MPTPYQIRKLKSLSKQARKAISLAEIYLDDGAPLSAARCYREAADAIQAWGEYRNKLMGR
jgi:hypothetical protein